MLPGLKEVRGWSGTVATPVRGPLEDHPSATFQRYWQLSWVKQGMIPVWQPRPPELQAIGFRVGQSSMVGTGWHSRAQV